MRINENVAVIPVKTRDRNAPLSTKSSCAEPPKRRGLL